MKSVYFQKSNILAYLYIFLSICMTSMFFNMIFDDLEAVVVMVIYYILMLFVLDEWIICKMNKIRYNLPKHDLKRIQGIIRQSAAVLLKNGYKIPTQYRIGYINDPIAFKLVSYSHHHIALSRNLLDEYTDSQLKALLSFHMIQMSYKLPFLNYCVYISNVVVLLAYGFYFLAVFLMNKVISLLSKPIANSLSIFLISPFTIVVYFMHKLKVKSSIENNCKCDEEVCKLGMKLDLLEALSLMHFHYRMDRKLADDLQERIFRIRSL